MSSAIRVLKICVIFLLCPALGKAKIIETAHITEVLPLIDKKTWFFVDLDNTLFEAQQALGHANWFYDEVQRRIAQGMTRNDAIKDAYPDWIKTQNVCRVKTLENEFVPSLIHLQQQGVVVIGFTHRQPSVADATIKQVASLGFDFSKTAPSQDNFTILAAYPTLYKQGIFFVSDYNKKGDVLMPFLNILGRKPKKIVFIDDKRKNVEELESELAKERIEYIGVHYTAINEVKPVYIPEVAEFQYKFLNQIMSNEAAMLLMAHEMD